MSIARDYQSISRDVAVQLVGHASVKGSQAIHHWIRNRIEGMQRVSFPIILC